MKIDPNKLFISLRSASQSIKHCRFSRLVDESVPFDRAKSDSIIYFSVTPTLHAVLEYLEDQRKIPITKEDLLESSLDFSSAINYAKNNVEKLFFNLFTQKKIIFEQKQGFVSIHLNGAETCFISLFLNELIDYFKSNFSIDNPIVFFPSNSKIFVGNLSSGKVISQAAFEELDSAIVPLSSEVLKITKNGLMELELPEENMTFSDYELIQTISSSPTEQSEKLIENVKILKEILTRSDSLKARLHLAKSLLFLGNTQEAFLEFQRLWGKSVNAQTYLYLGTIYQQKEDFTNAIDCYKKATMFLPEYPAAYFNLASSYKVLQKYSEALENADMYLLLKPDSAGFYLRGVIHLLLNNLQKSISDLNICLKLNPNHTDAKSLLEKIS